MTGSIERLWRRIPRHQVVPVALLAVVVTANPDPTHRPTGYGGVLAVPSATPSSPATARHPDPLLEQQRRDFRASHGRVLYAPGHAPAAEPASANGNSSAKATRHAPCAERRVVQQRTDRTTHAT